MLSTVPELVEILSYARAASPQDGGDKLTGALGALVRELDAGNAEAVSVLHALADAVAKEEPAGLILKTISLANVERPIRLLLTKAVFSPEFWGRTFAEGLLKDKEQFQGAKVVEIGTGSGWVSLLLLLVTNVKEVLGLDLNPVAIVMARLNTWLNGTTADGTRLKSLAGDDIVDSFRSEVSDLLGSPLSRGESFDHVVGCIPQVLHPNPLSVDLQSGSDAALAMTEKDLYDLSNYCFEQGILEDRFGLPLIARALEQAQLCLKNGGKVTLVLGGRPGRQAIESMFERRGYDAHLVWMRRIQQADDTDLASLVELERAHSIKFHFFMARESDSEESLSASTAVKLLKAGKNIYHDLLVYQASTRFESGVFTFVRNLQKLGLESLRAELDFSRLGDERVKFLSRLSQSMLDCRAIPYTHERGDESFRRVLASYLRNFCYYPISKDDLFVSSGRAELVSLILKIVAAQGDGILLSSSCAPEYMSTAQESRLDITVGNDDLGELCQLDDLVAPKVVLISPKQLLNPSPITFKALCQQARKHPDRIYLIDDSQNFSISSDLGANMTLRFAGQTQMPTNLILLYGLIKNSISQELQLSFLVNAPRLWLDGLDIGAELSYSRIAYPTQLLYEWLFEDLLTLPFAESLEEENRTTAGLDEIDGELKAMRAKTMPVSAVSTVSTLIEEIGKDAVFQPKPLDVETRGLIRLDYGEFETAPPDILVKGLFKGFIDVETPCPPQVLHERVASYLKFTRHAQVEPERIVLAQGVFPLFGALLSALKHKLGRAPLVAVPEGGYGPIFTTLAYYGAEELIVKTASEKAFLLSVKDLQAMKVKPDLLWLTQPGNPSGAFIDPDRLRSLIEYCHSEDIYVLSDEIFFLLSDHRLGKWTPSSLSVGSYLSGNYRSKLFVTDGISKSFAAPGLRAGFLATPDAHWAELVARFAPPPPAVVLRAWDGLYSAFLDKSPHQMLDVERAFKEVEAYLIDKRKGLGAKRERLYALLKKYNLDDGYDSPYRGGLFLLAKLGHLSDALAREELLLVNPPAWGRTEGMVRICYCISDERFNEAISRLESFLARHYPLSS